MLRDLGVLTVRSGYHPRVLRRSSSWKNAATSPKGAVDSTSVELDYRPGGRATSSRLLAVAAAKRSEDVAAHVQIRFFLCVKFAV